MFAWFVTLWQRIEDISSDIQRQMGDRKDFYYSSLACHGSTDASDAAQLLIILRGGDNDMNVTGAA